MIGVHVVHIVAETNITISPSSLIITRLFCRLVITLSLYNLEYQLRYHLSVKYKVSQEDEETV